MLTCCWFPSHPSNGSVETFLGMAGMCNCGTWLPKSKCNRCKVTRRRSVLAYIDIYHRYKHRCYLSYQWSSLLQGRYVKLKRKQFFAKVLLPLELLPTFSHSNKNGTYIFEEFLKTNQLKVGYCDEKRFTLILSFSFI